MRFAVAVRMINRMSDEYTYEDLLKDIDFLVEKGLIEIGGITPEGKWLYKATDKSLSMTEEEREALICEELEKEQD